VCGGATLAGFACLDRGVIRPGAWVTDRLLAPAAEHGPAGDLGDALTPALQRFWAAAETAPSGERQLGTLGDIDVFAVRGDGRSVTIGSSRARLASSEGIVLRERASKF
jgi:hypothetical protein